MNETIHFLERHGYCLLAGAILGRQACLPIPANLFLVAAGALAHSGKLNLGAILGLSLITFVLADLGWYEAGRRWRERTLHFLGGLSRDPGSLVHRAGATFARHGVKTLLISKFVIGLDAVAAPLTGANRIGPMTFVLFDAVGALFWSTAYVVLGYAFSNQLDRVALHLARIGTLLALAVAAAIAVYMVKKLIRWERFVRQFRLARIAPEELNDKLNAGEDILLIDLQDQVRHSVPAMAIPGAVRINPHRLEQYRDVEIAPSREVVLYCASPGEFTSARVALALQRRGIDHVHPLAGGLRGWRERGFPVTTVAGVPMISAAALAAPVPRPSPQ